MVVSAKHVLQAQQNRLKTEHVQSPHDLGTPVYLRGSWEVEQPDVWKEGGPHIPVFDLSRHHNLVSGILEEILHEVVNALFEVFWYVLGRGKKDLGQEYLSEIPARKMVADVVEFYLDFNADGWMTAMGTHP